MEGMHTFIKWLMGGAQGILGLGSEARVMTLQFESSREEGCVPA